MRADAAHGADRRRPPELSGERAGVAGGGGLRRDRRGRGRRVGATGGRPAASGDRPARRAAAGRQRLRRRRRARAAERRRSSGRPRLQPRPRRLRVAGRGIGRRRLHREGRALRAGPRRTPPVSIRRAVVLWTLALLAAGVGTALVFTSDHEDDPWLTVALAVPVGLFFVAGGLVAWRTRPANRTGLIMTLVGFSCFA